MLLSPLYIQALSLNQWVTDTLFLYRQPPSWDPKSQQFCLETRRRHTLPYLLVNFGFLGLIWIPCLLSYFHQALYHPELVSAMEVMIIFCQLVLLVMVLCTAVAYQNHGTEQVGSLNEICLLEETLSEKYANRPRRVRGHPRQKVAPWWRNIMSQIRQPNGELDIFAIIAIWLIVTETALPPFLSLLGMWMEQDGIFLRFHHLLPQLTLSEKVIFHLARAIVIITAVVEGCCCFRTLGVNSLVGVRGMFVCHTLLISQPISETAVGELRQLYVLFAMVKNMAAFLFSVYMGMLYLLLVAGVAMAVAQLGVMPWLLYLSIIQVGIISACFVVVLWFLVVGTDEQSSELHDSWKYSCSQLRNSTELQRKILYRLLKSIQPIRIPYGSLGTFTKATRTDCFSSIMEHAINAILTLSAN